MFLGYIVLQLFCIYSLCYINVILPVKYVVYFYINTFRSMCAVPNMAVFCGYLISCFPVICSGIVWVILKWFQSPLLLLASLSLSHSTFAEFLLQGLYMVLP